MAKKKNKKNILPIRKKEKKEKPIEKPTYSLWSEMDQLFDQMRTNLDDLFLRRAGPDLTGLTDYRAPLVDMIDQGDKYEMSVDLPGISKEDINLEVTPNNIEISAEHEETEKEEDKNWLRRERTSTSFYRSFDLPEDINPDNVDAEMKKGVLSVTLPKKEPKPKYKSKQVKIK